MKFTKKFYLALASFVVLLLQAFGLKFDLPAINEVISAGASLLVMLGIICDSHGAAKTDSGDGSTDTDVTDITEGGDDDCYVTFDDEGDENSDEK